MTGDPEADGIAEVSGMTRQEHLAWCKQRALEYVNGGATSTWRLLR